MFECVINVSEGRDLDVLEAIGERAGESLRDRHSDTFHNRSVYTLINAPGPLLEDVRGLIATSLERLDLRTHQGVHPRFGVVDVVPFVSLERAERALALTMRDSIGHWISTSFEVPVFYYGPVGDEFRTLPQVRRRAFRTLAPDLGPREPTARSGAVALGERPVLVAWNLWLSDVSLERARAIAGSIRSDAVRSLAFAMGEQVQVSCNLIAPELVGPAAIYDQVTSQLSGVERIERAELVGLMPASVLDAQERARWDQLGLSDQTTIESRLS
ncbi:MAG: hypothetical protein HKL86_10850 [Acidimicrobiaceae bacterium]|nr:hypothetical protein [Acidimicrobiaceae bacterium]